MALHATKEVRLRDRICGSRGLGPVAVATHIVHHPESKPRANGRVSMAAGTNALGTSDVK